MRTRNLRRGRRGAGGSFRQSMESGITLMRVHLYFPEDFHVRKHCNASAMSKYLTMPRPTIGIHLKAPHPVS